MGGKVTYSEKTAIRILKLKAGLEWGKTALRDCESLLFSAYLPLATFPTPPKEARQAFELALCMYRDLIRIRESALAKLLALYKAIMDLNYIPSDDEYPEPVKAIIEKSRTEWEPLQEEREALGNLRKIMDNAEKCSRDLSRQMLEMQGKKNGGKHGRH